MKKILIFLLLFIFLIPFCRISYAASGDTLVTFTAQSGTPPATRFATPDTFADASTPTLTHLVLDFDPGSTTEFRDFLGVMPGQYDGSSALDVVIVWSAVGTSTGNVKWDVAFKSVTDDADNLTTKAFATIQTVTSTTASASGEVDYATIAFSNAQADSVGANEMFILRVERDGPHANDTMSGNDAELHFVTIELQ